MNHFALSRSVLLGPAVEVLAPLGWASFGRWHQQGTQEIVRLSRRGAGAAEIDELVTEQWHTKSEIFLRHIAAPLRGYGRNIDHQFQRIQQQRANLIDQAIECHKNGHYAASTLLTFAQIDGLTRDMTGATFFSASKNDLYLDDSTLAGIATNLPVVREQFTESIDSTDFHGKISRHGAAHGRDLSFGTKPTSTKALVLLGALVEYLADRAAERARKYRKEYESTVKGKLGVDGNGRLNDDRHLDQLYFFDADLDGHIMMDALNPKPRPEAWIEEAHKLLKERTLSRRNFTWGGANVESYWWFYETPAGHYLGAAARKYGSGPPVDWRNWHWDSLNPPEGGPWNQSGWTEFDGNTSTANWTIEPFPTL